MHKNSSIALTFTLAALLFLFMMGWRQGSHASIVNSAAVQTDNTPASALHIWGVDSLQRIGLEDSPQPAELIAIAGARNEDESFQVVVSAVGQKLTGVSASISDFVGEAGVIPHANTALFREHFVYVPDPSPLSPLAPGWFADALIPFTNPDGSVSNVQDPLYRAVPFDVKADANQPLWVDVSIPPTAAAGVYTATITVTANDGLAASLPARLTVWNFALADAPVQYSHFGLDRSEIYDLYGVREKPAEFNRILRDFSSLLLDHRLMPSNYGGFDYTISESGEFAFYDAEIPGTEMSAERQMEIYFAEKGVNSFQIPIYETVPFARPLGADWSRAKRFMGTLASAFKAKGWADYLYVYVVDEPASARLYDHIREWGALVDEVNLEYDVEILLLVTEQPETENSRWGTLIGAVDVWVPCCDQLWNDQESPAAERLLSERLAAGEQVWWYTALVQPPDAWMEMQDWPDPLTANYPPIWLLDYPPINYRVASWLTFKYEMSGLLYWAVNSWHYSAEPWTDPVGYMDTDGRAFNGEGMLVYPGRQASVGFDGPIASMRLKWLRDGMDDYDYLAQLRALGDEANLQQDLATVVQSADLWSIDPAELLAARCLLGARLDALSTQAQGSVNSSIAGQAAQPSRAQQAILSAAEQACAPPTIHQVQEKIWIPLLFQ